MTGLFKFKKKSQKYFHSCSMLLPALLCSHALLSWMFIKEFNKLPMCMVKDTSTAHCGMNCLDMTYTCM